MDRKTQTFLNPKQNDPYTYTSLRVFYRCAVTTFSSALCFVYDRFQE